MSKPELHLYEFGPFRLDVLERVLFRGEEIVSLPPKVIDTLLVLVENNGRMLEKAKLMTILWPDTFVEESSLAQHISILRKALGERPDGRQYIETIPKRGYRFVADVRDVQGSGPIRAGDREADELLSAEDQDFEKNPRAASEPIPLNAGLAVRSRPSSLKLYLILASACILLAGTLIVLSRRWAATQVKTDAPPRAIAVLPFKALGAPDNEQEIIGLGITDAIILQLSDLPGTTVLPTSSIYGYTKRDKDVYSIGRDLGVEAVLDGTVQRAGERVRVTAQLIRLADRRVLWSGTLDNQFRDIFALQDSISRQVAAALTPQFAADARGRLAKQYTRDPEAYQAYMIGIYFWNKRTKEGLTKAIEYFRQAIGRDPNYALAYAGLSDCYNLSLYNYYDIVPPAEAVEKRKAAAIKAIELDDNLPEAHMAMAVVNNFQKDPTGAEAEYQQALALNPNFAVARVRYAHFLMNALRLDEAVGQMRRAQELDPVSAVTNGALGIMLIFARRYEEAVKYCRLALELEPNAPEAHANLGLAYQQSGLLDEATAEFRMMPEDQRLESLQYLAYADAVAGRHEESKKILAELLELKGLGNDRERAHIMPYNIALIYAALGENDQAFSWLEQEKITPSVVTLLKYDPQLDALRADSRFSTYLRRHNLEYLLN